MPRHFVRSAQAPDKLLAGQSYGDCRWRLFESDHDDFFIAATIALGIVKAEGEQSSDNRL